MDLANYLKFLLYNHDSVFIPGLGTLITQYKHAEINTSEKSISPPSKYLIFDQYNTTTNDLLVNHIASAKQIDNKQASHELKKIITDFINKLNQEETVLLEGIGYFSKENDIIRYEKEQDANFLTESFGLTKIDFEPTEIEITPHNPQIVSSKHPIRKTPLILALLIILVAGGGVILYLYYPNLLNYRTKKISYPAIRPIVAAQKIDSATTDTSGRKTDIEKFFESTTDKKNALSIPTPKTEINFKYYIIAGSFKTFKMAEILAKEIEKDGYKTQVIEFKSSIFRISLGEYTSKEKALLELGKIRDTKGDNTVWLLSVAP